MKKEKLALLAHLTKGSNKTVLLRHESASDDIDGAFVPYGWARVSDHYQSDFFVVWQKAVLIKPADASPHWVWKPERGEQLRNESVHRLDIALKYTIVGEDKLVETSHGGLSTASLVKPNEHLVSPSVWIDEAA